MAAHAAAPQVKRFQEHINKFCQLESLRAAATKAEREPERSADAALLRGSCNVLEAIGNMGAACLQAAPVYTTNVLQYIKTRVKLAVHSRSGSSGGGSNILLLAQTLPITVQVLRHMTTQVRNSRDLALGHWRRGSNWTAPVAATRQGGSALGSQFLSPTFIITRGGHSRGHRDHWRCRSTRQLAERQRCGAGHPPAAFPARHAWASLFEVAAVFSCVAPCSWPDLYPPALLMRAKVGPSCAFLNPSSLLLNSLVWCRCAVAWHEPTLLCGAIACLPGAAL